MKEQRTFAVAGATGRVGRHVVDVLKARGHQVVPMSRSTGVDVITGDGLADALEDIECVVDRATGPSPEQDAVTEFFTAAARNVHEARERAGVKRIVVISIIGCDRFSGGNPDDPDSELYLTGALLPGPHATLAGPTFEQWLDSASPQLALG